MRYLTAKNMDEAQARRLCEGYLKKLGLSTTAPPLLDHVSDVWSQLRFPDTRGLIWLNLRAERLTSLSRTTHDGKRALPLDTPSRTQEARVRERLTTLLRTLGLDQDYVRPDSLVNRDDEGRAEWCARFIRTAHGLPFLSQPLFLTISGQGEVLQLDHPTYTPPPSRPKPRVSAKEAVQIAEACIRCYGLELAPARVGTVAKNHLFVAPSTFWEPSNWGERLTQRTFRHGSPDSRDDTTRAAWIVPRRVLSDESHLFYGASPTYYFVFVDSETGKVVGGSHAPSVGRGVALT